MPPFMRYVYSMVAFVDGGFPFGSLFFHLQLLDLFVWIVERYVGRFTPRFRSRSLESDLTDADWVDWMCRMRPAGMKRPLALFITFLWVISACSTVLYSSASARYSSQASA